MTRVLVVDDDAAIRETTCFALEDAGYEVAEAPDGKTALDTLRASAEAMVVLLDRIMPPPDGEAVLEAILADDQLVRRHTYVLMTASPTRIAAPFAHLLSRLDAPIVEKPFDVDVLLQTVAAAAERLRSQVPSALGSTPADPAAH